MKVTIQVHGFVQGVGFRYMTKRLADSIGVYGIVRNLNNGDVFIEVCGEDAKVTKFIEEVKKGPSPSAMVESIAVREDLTLVDYTTFEVKM